MEAKAIAKYERISPLKVNFICREIRGKNVDDALTILKFTPKKGARLLEKVLKSAVANAENNHSLERSKLYATPRTGLEATVTEDPRTDHMEK